ncbi:MAG: TetR family transcriptional regulator [Microbacterium sp.]|nr:TetR family transcriptional regulator [Microbacterium sp.]
MGGVDERAARARADIIEVATSEFAQHGYAGARVDDMADRMRTTKRMIYYYFGSKEALYLTVLERVYAQIRQVERDVRIDELRPDEALRTLGTHPVARRRRSGSQRGDLPAGRRRDRRAHDDQRYACFHVANRHTFAAIFERDMLDPALRSAHRRLIGDMVVATMTAPRGRATEED